MTDYQSIECLKCHKKGPYIGGVNDDTTWFLACLWCGHSLETTKKIAKTSSLMEVFGKAHSETNPGWIRIVLNLMAQVLIDQGVATNLPRLQDQIARSENKWLISASFVSVSNHKKINPN